MKLGLLSTYKSWRAWPIKRPEYKATLCSSILKSFGDEASKYQDNILNNFYYNGQKKLDRNAYSSESSKNKKIKKKEGKAEFIHKLLWALYTFSRHKL